MKLSFSTRGWADRSWDELVGTALEMDFSGIEIHNPITNTAFTGKGGPLDRSGLRGSRTHQPLRPDPMLVGAADAVGVVVGVVDAHLQGQRDEPGEHRPQQIGAAGEHGDAGAREDR